jgi:GWxTD domain-containing protein
MLAGFAALSVLAPTAMASQTGQPVESVAVRAFRFYRAEGHQTLVTAFVEVPYDLLEAPTAANGELKYGVVVQITDASGIKLNEAAWPGRARADLRGKRASKLEILDFSVAPGKYHVSVAVTDSVSGRQFSSGTDVEAWSDAPGASDLMLSPHMRLVTDSDTMPQMGERRWGNTMVTQALRLRLTPDRAKAFYMLEAYAEAPDSGTMQVKVTDSTGHAVVSTRPAAVRLATGGSVLKGQLDLTGLPAGRYRMTIELATSGSKQERSDEFVMADLQETLQREQELASLDRESDAGYFGAMTEAQLNEAEEPLIYLASSDSLSVWKSGLSLQAKQQFLIRFWDVRDPSPSTPKNELREQFYGLIAQANRAYGEGGRSTTPGWKTDRGRVFVKYGSPAEVLDRRTPSGQSPPYQVWRYTRGKEIYYIFADRSGFGAYKLLASNNLRETSTPGYADILGAVALQDISRWLGIDLFREQNGGAGNQQCDQNNC